MRFWTFERQLVAGLIAVGLALVAIFAVSVRNTSQLMATSWMVGHTQEVLGDLESLQSAMVDTETGVRGYLITGQKAFLDPYYAARPLVGKRLGNLTSLTADNPDQQKRLSILNEEISRQLGYYENLVITANALGIEAGRKIVMNGAGKTSMDEIRQVLGDMRHEEERLLRIRQRASEQSNRNTNSFLSVLRVFMISVLAGSYFITRREMKLRRRAEQGLQTLNDELEQRVQARTADLEEASLALRESEARLQTSLENLSEGVIIANMDGQLLHFNRAALALHGFSALEESRLDLPGFTRLIELFTLNGEIIPLERWPLSRIVQGETLKNLEVEVRHVQAGWSRIFSHNGSLARDAEGKPLLAVITITDITERKKSEHKIVTQLQHLRLLDQTTRLIGDRLDLQSIFQVVIRSLEDSLPVDFSCIALFDAAQNTLTVSRVGLKNKGLASEIMLVENGTVAVDDNGLGQCTRGELVYESDISSAPYPFTKSLARGGLRSLAMAPLRSESQVFGVLLVAK